MEIEMKKAKTPKFRVSYPHVFEPNQMVVNGTPQGEPKYSITMLFSKSEDLTVMKKAAHNAAVEKWGSDKSKWPKFTRQTFRDGDEEKPGDENYLDMFFVSAKSKKKPGLVDQRLQPITAENDFYAGCYARATLIAYAYNTAGNVGVSFALQNIQKLEDGEALGGKRNASDDFEAVDAPKTEDEFDFGV